MSSQQPPHEAEPADALRPYEVQAFRFTVALDVAATTPQFATELVLGILGKFADLAGNPLGGQALHDAIGGRLLNVLCFNDPAPCTEPINPQEVMQMREMVEQLQAGDAGALQQLLGGMAPPADNGAAE